MQNFNFKKSFQNALRQQDIFGHPISLNFNRKGDHHKTLVGGFISIWIKILYFSYMIFLLSQLFLYEDDKTFRIEYQKEIGFRSWNETGIALIHDIQYYDQNGFL